MKNTTYTFDQAPNKNWTPQFTQVPWLNSNPIDYNLLLNKP